MGDFAMPKRVSTILVMQDFSPFSTRRWYGLAVQKAGRVGRGTIRIELTVQPNAAVTQAVPMRIEIAPILLPYKRKFP